MWEPAIRRDELDGVPLFWCEPPHGMSPAVGVVFRVGRADETVATGGISHVVEHLALSTQPAPGAFHNGVVETVTTSFWLDGGRPTLGSFLESLCARLADPPAGGLERERSVILTEAAGWMPGYAGATQALRYGARGVGLAGFHEFGLHWLGADDVRRWAADWFTRGNCALYLVGHPGSDLRLTLPDGPRRPPPSVEPLPNVRYPSVFADGPEDAVVASWEPAVAVATSVALNVLERRVMERLRHRHGVSYAVQLAFEPLTAETAHAVLSADALAENVTRARNALLVEMDELATAGATDEERARERAEWERA